MNTLLAVKNLSPPAEAWDPHKACTTSLASEQWQVDVSEIDVSLPPMPVEIVPGSKSDNCHVHPYAALLDSLWTFVGGRQCLDISRDTSYEPSKQQTGNDMPTMLEIALQPDEETCLQSWCVLNSVPWMVIHKNPRICHTWSSSIKLKKVGPALLTKP